MTSVSIIRQFYASPRTLIILLPLLEGITDETLPPKSDGFYLRLGKIKLANKCQAIFEKNWIVKKGNFNKHHSR